MKDDKGNLKNKLAAYNFHKQQKKRIKEAEALEKKVRKQDKINSKKKDRNNEENLPSKVKNSLRTTFGTLFTAVENICKQSPDEKSPEGLVVEVIEESSATYNEPMVELVESNEVQNDEYVLDGVTEQADNISSFIESITEITEQMNEIKNELETVTSLSIDIDLKCEQIDQIKAKIHDLKKLYEQSIFPFKEQLKELDLTEIDIYNLRYSDKQINNLLNQCDEELSKVKKQSSSITISDFISVNELEKIKNILADNLKEQESDVEEIKQSFKQANLMDKRATLVTGIHTFLSKTINVGINLLSTPICNDKLGSMMCSAVIINNRLRNVRKIIRKDNDGIVYITYQKVINDLKTKKLCVDKIGELLDDTMNQLENLKQEFIIEFYYDMDRYEVSEDIMTEFSSIEYQITSKNIELEGILKEEPEKGIVL